MKRMKQNEGCKGPFYEKNKTWTTPNSLITKRYTNHQSKKKGAKKKNIWNMTRRKEIKEEQESRQRKEMGKTEWMNEKRPTYSKGK